MVDYAAQLSQIHTFYHQRKYQLALKLCEELLSAKNVPPVFSAQILRRKADCIRALQGAKHVMELYDQAIQLCPADEPALAWILESKALALMELARFDEAISIIGQAIGLVTDRIDFEHLQEVADEILDQQEDFRSIIVVDQKDRAVQSIRDRAREIEEAATKKELELILQHTPQLEA